MDDKLINELIKLPKKITKKPKAETKLVNGSYRNDFELALVNDESVKFIVRFRKNKKFSENFSVILSYYSKELSKNIFLVRYNGAHIHTNKIIDTIKIDGFHIHKATAAALNNGNGAEAWAYETKEYTTFEEAAIKFWDDINIQDDFDKFFREYKEIQLFLFDK